MILPLPIVGTNENAFKKCRIAGISVVGYGIKKIHNCVIIRKRPKYRYIASLNKNPPPSSKNRPLTRGGSYLLLFFHIFFVRKIWSRLKEYHTMNPHINYRLIRVTIPFCSRRRRRRKNFKWFSKENLRSTSTCTLSTLWESQIKYQTRDYHSTRLLGKILHYPKKICLNKGGGSYLLLFIKFQNVP